MNHNPHPLRGKLEELENLFASGLTGNKGPEELTTIWNQIKEIRLELNEPVYGESIPGGETSGL
jgi:hypothetical protein